MRMGYTPHSSSDLAPAHPATDPQLGIALKLTLICYILAKNNYKSGSIPLNHTIFYQSEGRSLKISQ
jgi:hypothetical protein